MSLVQILLTIHDELIENGTLTLGTPLIIGGNPKEKRDVPLSMFWVPKRGIGKPPDVAMNRAVQQAAIQAGQPIPRTLKVRGIQVDCHLWAGGPAATDDFSASEDAIEALISAVHHQTYGAYEYLGDEYKQTGTDATYLGRRLICHLEINVPLLERPQVPPSKQIDYYCSNCR